MTDEIEALYKWKAQAEEMDRRKTTQLVDTRLALEVAVQALEHVKRRLTEKSCHSLETRMKDVLAIVQCALKTHGK